MTTVGSSDTAVVALLTANCIDNVDSLGKQETDHHHPLYEPIVLPTKISPTRSQSSSSSADKNNNTKFPLININDTASNIAQVMSTATASMDTQAVHLQQILLSTIASSPDGPDVKSSSSSTPAAATSTATTMTTMQEVEDAASTKDSGGTAHPQFNPIILPSQSSSAASVSNGKKETQHHHHHQQQQQQQKSTSSSSPEKFPLHKISTTDSTATTVSIMSTDPQSVQMDIIAAAKITNDGSSSGRPQAEEEKETPTETVSMNNKDTTTTSKETNLSLWFLSQQPTEVLAAASNNDDDASKVVLLKLPDRVQTTSSTAPTNTKPRFPTMETTTKETPTNLMSADTSSSIDPISSHILTLKGNEEAEKGRIDKEMKAEAERLKAVEEEFAKEKALEESRIAKEMESEAKRLKAVEEEFAKEKALEEERIAKEMEAEAERLKALDEQYAKEKALEEERIAKEMQAEAERLKALEEQHAEEKAAAAEAARLEEEERIAKEKAAELAAVEAARLKAIEDERIAKEKAEAAAEAARLKAIEDERIAKEKAEAEAAAEAARLKAIEDERIAKEKAEAEAAKRRNEEEARLIAEKEEEARRKAQELEAAAAAVKRKEEEESRIKEEQARVIEAQKPKTKEEQKRSSVVERIRAIEQMEKRRNTSNDESTSMDADERLRAIEERTNNQSRLEMLAKAEQEAGEARLEEARRKGGPAVASTTTRKVNISTLPVSKTKKTVEPKKGQQEIVAPQSRAMPAASQSREMPLTQTRQKGTMRDSKGDKSSTAQLIALISTLSGSHQQKANQDRALTILRSHCLEPAEIIDGSDVANKDRRNELFEISKIRGNYPQFFLVRGGQKTFFGSFETIESMNDAGTLNTSVLKFSSDGGGGGGGVIKKATPPPRKSSPPPSSSNKDAGSKDGSRKPAKKATIKGPPTPANPTPATTINGKTLLVLMSNVSTGNREQQRNQEKAMMMLKSKKIQPEQIDASDPANKDRRNKLFEISGVRGNYPQFFLTDGKTTSFVGRYDEIETYNDTGNLKEALFGKQSVVTREKENMNDVKVFNPDQKPIRSDNAKNVLKEDSNKANPKNTDTTRRKTSSKSTTTKTFPRNQKKRKQKRNRSKDSKASAGSANDDDWEKEIGVEKKKSLLDSTKNMTIGLVAVSVAVGAWLIATRHHG